MRSARDLLLLILNFCWVPPVSAPNSEFLLGAAGLVFLDLDLDFSHRFVQGDIGQRAWFLFCPRTRFCFPVPVAAQLEFAIS
jgi:hypothetical protein